MVVYVKVLDCASGRAQEHYLCDVDLAGSASSEKITQKLISVLQKKEISLQKVTGLGTYGAPVMTGRRTGVGARLKDICPKVIQVHCVAHRLALASGQAADTVSLFKNYQLTVNAVYNYFQHSATCTTTLRHMQNVLDDYSVSLLQTFSSCWLSFRGAVDALRKSYVPLIAALVERADEGCATGQGLHKAARKGTFLLATYFLSDSLAVLTKLSLFFQKASLNVADISPMVVSTRQAMQAMKTARALVQGTAQQA